MKRQHLHIARSWIGRLSRKRLAATVGGGLLGLVVLTQLLYPGNKLVPWQSIEGQSFGGWSKQEAAARLDATYAKKAVPLYFGERTKPYRTPLPKDIGLSIANTDRLAAMNYAWWLRLVPTSLLWAHLVIDAPAPKYLSNELRLALYVEKELGQSCDVAPKNASLAYKAGKLQVVPAEAGGTCKAEDVRSRLAAVQPSLTTEVQVRVPMTTIPPAVNDQQAAAVADDITRRVGTGVTLQAGGQAVTAEASALLGWLDFTVTDNKLVAAVNGERAKVFMEQQVAPKVTRAAGVSKVTTQDFTEIARVNGATGQALDIPATLAALGALVNGQATAVTAVTKAVPPKVEYTRQYSPTDVGLNALLQQYAESHPGTFGISLAELGGSKRRAAFQDDRQFHTASTYKLYVAYAALKRVEAGTWKWSDPVHGGRNLEKCFDDMIVKSDNPCGEALLKKIGYRTLTDELKAVGLTGTTFLQDVPKTTARDLTTLLGSLEAGQLVSGDSRARLLGALQRNIYRQGIPAGAGVAVADKVGFLEGYLHDAAIVYGPTGPLVLTIMTDDSSWATIADLTRQIQALRAQ